MDCVPCPHCLDRVITVEEVHCLAGFAEHKVVHLVGLGRYFSAVPNSDSEPRLLDGLDHFLLEVGQRKVDTLHALWSDVLLFIGEATVHELDNFERAIDHLLHLVRD